MNNTHMQPPLLSPAPLPPPPSRDVAQLSGGLLCDLAPGDSLVVPAYWFVHAQLMQPACVSLELQLQPLSTRLRPPAALVLQLSRMMEGWFAAEVGPANVRRWFQVREGGGNRRMCTCLNVNMALQDETGHSCSHARYIKEARTNSQHLPLCCCCWRHLLPHTQL